MLHLEFMLACVDQQAFMHVCWPQVKNLAFVEKEPTKITDHKWSNYTWAY